MPIIRTWSATKQHGIEKITVTFEAPYYTELLTSNGGCLSRDFECHCLWDYFGCALQSVEKMKKNLVYEDELSIKFDREIARNLFTGKANQHGVRPGDMVRFWPMIMKQRTALGGKDELPAEFCFRWWGN